MPYGDGTGPEGRGPRTGRGLGYCAGYAAPCPGRGWGCGRGFGRRAFWAPAALPAPVELSKEQQIKVLEEEQKAVSGELEAIQKKLEELKK